MQLQGQQLQRPSMHRRRSYEHASRGAANGGKSRVQVNTQCECDVFEHVANERWLLLAGGP